MFYTIWYLDGNLNGVTKREDAVLVEVEDIRNDIAGQRGINDFHIQLLPREISSEGYDLWDIKYLLKPEEEVQDEPAEPLGPA